MLDGSGPTTSNPNVALIIGAGSQTALTLLKLLVENEYQVFGNARNPDVSKSYFRQYSRIDFSDVSDPNECWSLLDELKPSKIFHFAAVHAGRNQMNQVLLKNSSEMKKVHFDITKNILNWQRFNLQSSSHIALSSQMFSAQSKVYLISESSIPSPQNYYGETKLMAWNLLRNYRELYGVKTNGYILFNHGSIFTKDGFFVRDVANKIANLIIEGTPLEPIANRSLDISASCNICHAIMLIAQKDILGDFVLGSGKLVPISSIIGDVFENLKITQSKLPRFDIDLSRTLLSDITKINELIQWGSEITISNVITDLIQSIIAEKSYEAGKIL